MGPVIAWFSVWAKALCWRQYFERKKSLMFVHGKRSCHCNVCTCKRVLYFFFNVFHWIVFIYSMFVHGKGFAFPCFYMEMSLFCKCLYIWSFFVMFVHGNVFIHLMSVHGKRVVFQYSLCKSDCFFKWLLLMLVHEIVLLFFLGFFFFFAMFVHGKGFGVSLLEQGKGFVFTMLAHVDDCTWKRF